jgi:transcriptional regulator with XRE-family HTH domain
MKKYLTLGELLVDYRKENNHSQFDLAAILDVDIRSVQRWEKDESLIKPEKENELVAATLLPYQLIRNLNASRPIPTFYDFRIRKYALTKLNNELPDANWLKDRLGDISNRIRTILPDQDSDFLKRDLKFQKYDQKPISHSVLTKAIEILPELNLIILDHFSNYSGHCIVLPITMEAFERLKKQEIQGSELEIDDLSHYKDSEKPIFFNYSITADSNDNVFYLAHSYLSFFEKKSGNDYIFCSSTMRYDSYKLNEDLGLELEWELDIKKDNLGNEYHPRFYSGNFNAYFSDKTDH